MGTSEVDQWSDAARSAELLRDQFGAHRCAVVLGSGWAPVAEEARSQGNPQVWTVVEQWLKAQGGRVKPRQINTPTITSGLPNPGHA